VGIQYERNKHDWKFKAEPTHPWQIPYSRHSLMHKAKLCKTPHPTTRRTAFDVCWYKIIPYLSKSAKEPRVGPQTSVRICRRRKQIRQETESRIEVSPSFLELPFLVQIRDEKEATRRGGLVGGQQDQKIRSTKMIPTHVRQSRRACRAGCESFFPIRGVDCGCQASRHGQHRWREPPSFRVANRLEAKTLVSAHMSFRDRCCRKRNKN
jgi:hypothetical protein